MDNDAEILKYRTLLQRSAVHGEFLGPELHAQMKVILSLGIGSEVSSLIHDRQARSGISVEPSRRMAIPSVPVETPKKTREQLALEYQKLKSQYKPGVEPELLVAYGLDKNYILVHSKKANKDQGYRCPGCKTNLILRAGEKNTKHFAHKGDTGCNGETVLHLTAKDLIAQVINENSDPLNTTSISMDCSCEICKKGIQVTLPKNSFSGARVEHPIGVFVCDVVAQRGDEHVLAVEVCVTNAVNERKAYELAIPWIEVDAAAILENPYNWRPTQSRLKAFFCKSCREMIKNLRIVAEKWNLPLSQFAGYRNLSKSDYLAAVDTCWKCKSEIIWYWWLGVPFCESEPPKPVPRTVMLKFSKEFGGKYWANCCPSCNALQGDNFVFLDKLSPFKGLPMAVLPQAEARAKQQTASAVNAFRGVINRNFGG